MNIVKETKNQFDPSLMVTVVDVTKGVMPDTLYYNLRDKDRSVIACEPSFELTDPSYLVPRFYAERLLQNLGGRTFRLVSPLKLTIKLPNGRGGSELKTITAFKRCGDGEWHELTAEEVLEIEAGPKEEGAILPDADKPPKAPKAADKPPKAPGMSKKATKEPTSKKVEEAPLSEESIESGSIDEPTLDDVLGGNE